MTVLVCRFASSVWPARFNRVSEFHQLGYHSLASFQLPVAPFLPVSISGDSISEFEVDSPFPVLV
jgi:hypothetical protein